MAGAKNGEKGSQANSDEGQRTSSTAKKGKKAAAEKDTNTESGARKEGDAEEGSAGTGAAPHWKGRIAGRIAGLFAGLFLKPFRRKGGDAASETEGEDRGKGRGLDDQKTASQKSSDKKSGQDDKGGRGDGEVSDDDTPPRRRRTLVYLIAALVTALIVGGAGVTGYIVLVHGTGKTSKGTVDGTGNPSGGSAIGEDPLGVDLEKARKELEGEKRGQANEANVLDLITEDPKALPGRFDLPEIIVNLRKTARSRYLKILLSIEVEPNHKAYIEHFQPAIQESVIIFLSHLDENDLDGRANLLRVKAEILRRIRLVVGGRGVANVHIQNFVLN